jgi:hypothetical protein
MSPAVGLLVNHGYSVLFGYVLVSQLGAPLPSAPLLEHRSRKAPLDRRARWVTARSTAIWIGCTKRSTSGASHDLCG